MSRFHDAFISYGRADSKAFAGKLYDRLRSENLQVWFDFEDIPLGVDYQNQIDDGIEKADNFLFVIAPHSINSLYCLKEIELAIRRNKRIIPLLHVEQITQETWQQRFPNGTIADWEAYKEKGLHSSFPNMHPLISKINWVYFREGIDDFDAAFAGMLQIFDRQKPYVRQHTVLLAQALDWEINHRQSSHLLTGEERLAAEAWLKVRFKDEQPPCLPTDLHCEFISESIKNAHNLMTQVFLSYSEKERSIREKVARTLMRLGLTLWTNKTDIKTGADFQQVIDRGIEEADNIVFLLSPNSLESRYCQQELTYARQHNKRIIPLLVVPMDLEQVPAELRAIQFIDMTDHAEEAEYLIDAAKLIRALQEDAAYYEQHKTLLVRALKWERQKRNPSILLRGNDLRQAEAWLKLARERSQYPATPLHVDFISESLRQPPESTLDVFIAYSNADSDFVRKLNDGLQVQGKTTWFDQETLASGDDFQQEMKRGIERCNNVLYVISPNASQSETCASTVKYATSLHKRLVTVIYQDVAIADLDESVNSVQPIDFRKHEGDFFANFGDLLRTLDADPGYIRPHTRLLVRALEWEQHGRDDSYLLRGKDLAASEQWLQQAVGKEPQPTALQLQFLAASRELPRRRVGWRTVALSSLAIAAIVTGVRFLGLTQPLELWAYDRLLTARPSEAPDDRMLIVGIDEATLEMLPKRYEPTWGTVPDRALDDLLQVLIRDRANVISLDILRDYAAKPPLADRLKKTQNLLLPCKATGNGKTVQDQGVKPPPEVAIERVGFANLMNDGNKFVRRNLLLQAPDSDYCNTLESSNLVAARKYLEAAGKPYQSPIDAQGEVTKTLQFGKTPVRALEGDGSGYRNRDNQLDGYQALVNFRAHQGSLVKFAPIVSLKDVLENRISPEKIRNRIVLVGLTAETSTKADYWKTPYGEIPGVVLQAQQVSQLVSATLDHRPLIWWWSGWGETAWISGWTLVGGVLVWRIYRLERLAMAGTIAIVVLVGVCYGVLVVSGGWIPLVPSVLALIGGSAAIGIFTYRLRHP